MRLFIAEKKVAADRIVAALKAQGMSFKAQDGYFESQDAKVTWCVGHLLALKEPDDYDINKKKWRIKDLPLYYPQLERKVLDKTKRQFSVIKGLLKEADEVVHAGDIDNEGQLLVDEVLRYCKFKGKVYRLWPTEETVSGVSKALVGLKNNVDYEYLGRQAEARAICDMHVGFNLTRLMSLLKKGQTWNVGRVQSPILGLVVRRDLQHEKHVKIPYATVDASCVFGELGIGLKHHPKDDGNLDDEGRIKDLQTAQAIVDKIINQPIKIVKNESKKKRKIPPLPYNLIKLQEDANKKFGISIDDTLQITQDLRGKGLISYNRSDCQFLNEDHFIDAPRMMALLAGLPEYANFDYDTSIKTKAFDDSKVTAHHAIIPIDVPKEPLEGDEAIIYDLICRMYIAQFMGDWLYLETLVGFECQEELFSAKGRVDVSFGYLNVLGLPKAGVDLRGLQEGDTGVIVKAEAALRHTEPPARYSMATLLVDVCRAGKFCKSEAMREAFKKRHEEMKGEHSSGLGTSATISVILTNLIERGYLQSKNKGKTISSTERGRELYDILDDSLKYPDLTAEWHIKSKNIKNQEDVVSALDEVMTSLVNPIVEEHRGHIKDDEEAPCPVCGRSMFRKPNKKGDGFWWGCSGYNDKKNPCHNSMDDDNGVPVEKKKEPREVTDFECKECGDKLFYKKGISKKGVPYSMYLCVNTPDCKGFYYEKDGKPNYG